METPKLDYLGAVLSYHKPKDATVDRRLQASRTAFERLVLTNRNLPLRIRVRLWRTCIVSTMVYGLPQVGLTLQGATKLSVLFHRQLRHITRTPVHVFISNERLRRQHGLELAVAGCPATSLHCQRRGESCARIARPAAEHGGTQRGR